METAKEVLEHMKFQLDLLKITSMPFERTGPAVVSDKEYKAEAVRVMEELSSKLNQPLEP